MNKSNVKLLILGLEVMNIKAQVKRRLAHVVQVHVCRKLRGIQREYSSKPLKHSIVKRILVFKR